MRLGAWVVHERLEFLSEFDELRRVLFKRAFNILKWHQRHTYCLSAYVIDVDVLGMLMDGSVLVDTAVTGRLNHSVVSPAPADLAVFLFFEEVQLVFGNLEYDTPDVPVHVLGARRSS
jgi:hypothetical protein